MVYGVGSVGGVDMSIPKDLIRENKELSDWNIMTCYRGSIAHGMYVPNTDPNSVDDKDVMAVCVPPAPYYFGLKTYGSRGTREIKRDEWDIVVYEARKMMRLLAKSNPNVLMALWLEPKHYISKTPAWDLVLECRHLFATKAAYAPFIGYADSQLHRMTHHAHEGYMGEKRKRIVEKYGYDIKNAAHLIRLLRMGIEFMTEGVMHVERPDAKELLEIKRGEWALERVKEEASRLKALAREAYVRSPLPERPDLDKINVLCVEIVARHQLSTLRGG